MRQFLGILFILLLSHCSILNLILDASKNDSKCVQRLTSMANNFTTDPATLSLIMNSGKNINDLGNYIACQKNNDSAYHTLIIDNLPILLSLGLCTPHECTITDLSTLKGSVASVINSQISQILPGTSVKESDVLFKDPHDTGFTFSTFFVVSITIFGFMLLAAIIGSIFNKTKLSSCFDIARNWKELFKLNARDDRSLSIFDGIRTISMYWVVFGHSYFILNYAPLLDPTQIMDFITNFWNAIIYNGSFSVDIFFYLSAFLSGYVIMKKLKASHNKISFLQIIVHRLLRIYPLLAFVYLFYAGVLPPTGSGPVFYEYTKEVASCKKSWYYSFLFIRNFFTHYSCYNWTWYLSNDMQFFIFSLIIIYTFNKSRIGGYLLCLATIVGTTIATIIIAYIKNLSNSTLKFSTDFFWYYGMTYIRAPPYYVGLICGLCYYQYKTNESATISKICTYLSNSNVLRALISIFGFIGMLANIQLLYWFNKYVNDITRWEDTLQYSLSRLLFIIFFLMFILPSLIGKGRVLKWLFDNSFFQISSKLTYAAYLLHYEIISYSTYTINYGFQFSLFKSYFQFWDYAIIIYVASIIFTLLFESPIINIENAYIFPTRRAPAQIKTSDNEMMPIKSNTSE